MRLYVYIKFETIDSEQYDIPLTSFPILLIYMYATNAFASFSTLNTLMYYHDPD